MTGTVAHAGLSNAAITAILTEIMAVPDGTLDLIGFWRLFGGGGHCTLRCTATTGPWQGTLADVAGVEARHGPVDCRCSPERVTDFLRLADCHRITPGHWMARYREPG